MSLVSAHADNSSEMLSTCLSFNSSRISCVCTLREKTIE